MSPLLWFARKLSLNNYPILVQSHQRCYHFRTTYSSHFLIETGSAWGEFLLLHLMHFSRRNINSINKFITLYKRFRADKWRKLRVILWYARMYFDYCRWRVRASVAACGTTWPSLNRHLSELADRRRRILRPNHNEHSWFALFKTIVLCITLWQWQIHFLQKI